jgi:hypothetical protein
MSYGVADENAPSATEVEMIRDTTKSGAEDGLSRMPEGEVADRAFQSATGNGKQNQCGSGHVADDADIADGLAPSRMRVPRGARGRRRSSGNIHAERPQ